METMNRLERARAVVRDYPLPEKLRRIGESDIGQDAVDTEPLPYYDAFPSQGMIYIFGGSSVRRPRSCIATAPLDDLRIASYDEAGKLPDAKYYLSDFIEDAALLSFQPLGLFYLGGDAYDLGKAFGLISEDLRRAVEEARLCTEPRGHDCSCSRTSSVRAPSTSGSPSRTPAPGTIRSDGWVTPEPDFGAGSGVHRLSVRRTTPW